MNFGFARNGFRGVASCVSTLFCGESVIAPSRALTLIILLAMVPLASAATLQGTVRNGTTGKPAAGDNAVLLSLGQGMSESGRVTTDSAGRFSFTVPDGGGPHLVRVTHQGVNYFGIAPPGTTSVDVQVYEAAKKLDGITTPVEVVRFESDGSTLQVLELYAVDNKSTPPRTLMSDRTFEIVLPEGAQIDNSAAEGPGGQPVKTAAVPMDGKKNHYYFVFPLRPGETRFQIAYHLPYSGHMAFKPTVLSPLEHFVAVVPKTMQFTPDDSRLFRPMPDDQGDNVQVVTGAKPGEAIGFRLAGTGTLAAENDQSPAPGGQPSAQAGDMRPGGGLGPPIDAPDPLSRYRWYILGGFAALLAMGVFYTVSRRETGALAGATESGEADEPAQPAAGSAKRAGANGNSSRSAVLLEAMKEELFQLELDRQQQKISAAEYEKAKAALDETIKRALARSSEKLS